MTDKRVQLPCWAAGARGLLVVKTSSPNGIIEQLEHYIHG